jgi:hypothetical protein
MRNVVMWVLRLTPWITAVILFLQEYYLFGEDANFWGAWAVAKANVERGKWPFLPWTRRELSDHMAVIRKEIQTIKREG